MKMLIMKSYNLRNEIFGGIVFDKIFCCFALVNRPHFNVLKNFTMDSLEKDIIKNKINFRELEAAGYFEKSCRKKRLKSLCKPTRKYSSLLSGPIAVGILVTSKCNLNCLYCYAKNNPPMELTAKETELVAERLINSNILACWISGGEPTLWKYLLKFVSELKNGNMPVAIDSNGLNMEVLKEAGQLGAYVRISVDSHIPTIHNYARGNFSIAWKTAIGLSKSNIKVGIITVLHKHNIKNIKDFAKAILDIGINRWTILILNESCCSEKIKRDLRIAFSENKKLVNYIYEISSELKLVTTVIYGNRPNSTILIGTDCKYYTVKGTNRKILGDVKKDTITKVWNRNNGINKYNHLCKYIGMDDR